MQRLRHALRRAHWPVSALLMMVVDAIHQSFKATLKHRKRAAATMDWQRLLLVRELLAAHDRLERDFERGKAALRDNAQRVSRKYHLLVLRIIIECELIEFGNDGLDAVREEATADERDDARC
eukprot:IDg15755t1